MRVVPLRRQPGDDLCQALEAWMGEQQAQAGCLISAVGSLSLAQLRFAGAPQATPALRPPVQSLRSSSTTATVLAPMRRPRSRKRPSFSRVTPFTVIGWCQHRGFSGWRTGGCGSPTGPAA